MRRKKMSFFFFGFIWEKICWKEMEWGPKFFSLAPQIFFFPKWRETLREIKCQDYPPLVDHFALNNKDIIVIIILYIIPLFHPLCKTHTVKCIYIFHSPNIFFIHLHFHPPNQIEHKFISNISWAWAHYQLN